MGEIMKEMSTNMQILHNTFTKLAKCTFSRCLNIQLAMIQSELKVLTTEERVVEIAQMLSGTVI
jgi:DNA repair protein RecN (Recombination protein N)